MEGAAATEALRRAAPHWTLAGDKNLLEALQNLHERIISKCQETNKRLEEMVTALDDANIHLQNVNNKFTALSNTQFIESRVYDDDADVVTEVAPTEEQPKQQSTDMDIDRMKASLQVLESLHETVTILCDSDSNTDSDDDDNIARVVLKPKDLYADRPLPHIIGTPAWKSKWHAGLLPDESDSDSLASKRDLGDEDQFSDSEPEPPSDYPPGFNSETLGVPVRHDRTISSSSSELHSDPAATHPKPTQSDIAAELARRLGGAVTKIPEQDAGHSPPQPTIRKLYKPEQPAPGTIFSDEPPPLEMDQSEESDEDIFAEIHKNKPYTQSSREQSSVADDLFGRPVFGDVDSKPPPKPSVKETSPLFEDESEPELFAAKPKPTQSTPKTEDGGAKKPIGGMSLFGNNAESIGAAILRRNQRKSSSSDEDSDSRETSPQRTKESKSHIINNPLKKQEEINSSKDTKQTPQKQIERDIFDDLFAKSKEREQKEKERQEKEKVKTVKEPVKKEKKVDLFSDNIFDDIDDIFTSNIINAPPAKEKRKETLIFDEQDDLFSDVAVTKPKTNIMNVKDIESKTSKNKLEKEKSIFSSDEELFSDKAVVTKDSDKPKKVNQLIKESKSLFDDSDDDLFSDVTVSKMSNKPDTMKTKRTNENVTVAKSITNDVTKSKQDSKNNAQRNLGHIKSKNKVEDLFEEDDGESLFTNKKEKLIIDNKTNTTKETPKLIINDDTKIKESKTLGEIMAKSSKVTNSPNIFDDDEIDDLFTATQKLKSDEVKNDICREENDDSFRTDNKNIPTVKSDNIKSDSSTEHQNDNILKANPSILNVDDELFPKDNKKSNTAAADDDEVFHDRTIKSSTSNKDEALNNNEQDTTTPKAKEVIEPNQEKLVDNLPKENLYTKPNPNLKPKLVEKPRQPKEISEKSLPKGIVLDDKTEDSVRNLETVVHRPASKEVDSISKPVVIEDAGLDNTKEVDANKNITYTQKRNYKEIKRDNNKKDITVETKHEDKDSIIKENAKQDIFTDIFNDQPPVFEKPKEPKKSKNVNALFDDDSDDENLFFKKSDVTLEEIPEDFSSANDDRLFGLFIDEPPAIDVNFVQEPVTKDVVADGDDAFDHNLKKSDIFNVGIEESTRKSIKINSSTIKDDNGQKSIRSDIFSNVTDDIFKKQNEIDIFGEESNEIVFKRDELDKLLKGDDLFKTQILDQRKQEVTNTQTEQDNITINTETMDKPDGSQAETKKIGKLKPMNLNINVNTLLPGASPKKVAKPVEQTDGQTISTKSNEELRSNEVIETNTDAKLVKSVSFEGKPESNVLDNTLSKERAKIQVKRRPSTRRARREAVKKSGIDFGDDSTDNSSSIDDHPRSLVVAHDEGELTANTEETSISERQTSIRNTNYSKSKILRADDTKITDFDDTKNVTYDSKDVLDYSTDIDSSEVSLMKADIETSKTGAVDNKTYETSTTNKNTGTIPKTSPNRDVKSKVVYILNDEDIFNTKPSQETAEKPKNVLNIVDGNDDDIFKTIIPTNPQKVDTLGKTSEPVDANPKNILANDEDDDDEIFKTMKPSNINKSKTFEEPAAKKVENFLDSDEENLFKSSSKNKLVDAQNPKQKSSIFGDLDDEALFSSKKTLKQKEKRSIFGSDSEEELFSGAKKEKGVGEKSVDKEIKRVEVKGSLFGDESDDDLFGTKTKKITDSQPKRETDRSKPPKELHSKATQPVFEDPLSLLGGDD